MIAAIYAMASLRAALTVLLIFGVPLSASAIEAPAWSGPKDHEAKYRQDWYACYSEAERTVPAVSVQAAGQQSMTTVALALAMRSNSVRDLTLACMRARGYRTDTDQAK